MQVSHLTTDDESVSLCLCLGLSVSLSVCLFACVSEKHVSDLRDTFCTRHRSVASSDDSAIRYVLPVLWMTCLPVIGETNATPVGRILKMTHQGAAPRAKSDVCHCLV